MIFSTEWRLRRIETRISGLTEQLKATKEIFNACISSVPGSIVINLMNLPKEIVELKAKAEYLRRKMK